MIRFVLVFVLTAVALFAVYWITELTQQFGHVNRFNAMLSGFLLNAIGVDNTCSGTLVNFSRGGMEVISECSGVYVAILFMAGVIAFPTSWNARLRGLALGLPTIFVINVVRLVTLGAIIRYQESLLPLFHEYLWQVFFIIVVATLYLVWIERMVPRARLGSAT